MGFNLLVGILLLQTLTTNCEKSHINVCKSFARGFNDVPYFEKVETIFDPKCPPTSSDFSVFNVRSENGYCIEDNKNYTLLVCWSKDIRQFSLQFETAVTINDDIPTSGRIISACMTANDTVFYSRKHHTHKGEYSMLLNLPATSKQEYQFKAFFDRRNIHRHSHRKRRFLQYKLYTNESKRKKRSVEIEILMSDESECGKTMSCYRQGENDCGHFECEYFLSYNITNGVVNFEMSAKTSGWVAVGFSSDNSMGGDEVVACSRKRPQSTEVETGTWSNPYAHDQTRRSSKPNAIVLKSFNIQDGFLYCHVTRPLTLLNHQDLTNTWFQLYAYGPVSPGGELEKHTITPSVSTKMRSLVQTFNVYASDGTSNSAGYVAYIIILTLFVVSKS